MLDMFEDKLQGIKAKYGQDCLDRVAEMFDAGPEDRHPLQSGAKYIMKGLSTTPWLDIENMCELKPLVQRLEAVAPAIKEEVREAVRQKSSTLVNYEHYLGAQKDWSALYLYRNEKPKPEVQQVVPVTWDVFQNELRDWHCPLLEVHFSLLHPGAEIKPHSDLWNFTLNLQLAVDIPEAGCEITVANEPRNWQEGKCLIFDYSYEHHAHNHSDQNRICLLMDIWHPDLTAAEREALHIVFSEIRRLTGM
ncbi:aspartyl/asparaginyl beta-hydroxylase-like dioxygenase [Rheinheimera sp. A13L]|uniref:aspartyl/asparaginyl beta-hydroxylase domain-containing protein n=1 Tax=Rheinheimera sp. A13L TaxID=506534 RepID=UPI00021248E7|nr:aspartyl/asparaginyl beta-hydroxylase domain-containing protein [Rheinheimera sp. A13L]EGM76575.1 aspartyl/asparaginyl beta-hydroxylase-like dioxygenase [Rheinheimera sp. A13L]